MKKINHKNRIMAFLLTVVMLVGLVSGTGVFNTSASEEGEATSVSAPADSTTTSEGKDGISSVPTSAEGSNTGSSSDDTDASEGKTASSSVTTEVVADEEAEESPFHQEIAILDDKKSPALTFTIDADEGVFPDGTIAVVKTIPADDDTSSPAMSANGVIEDDQLQGMPDYSDIEEKLNDEVEKSGKSISAFAAYDISFYKGEESDGKLTAIEPQTGVNGNKAVKVSVSYTGEQSALKVDGDVSVYHLALSEDRSEIKEVKELTTTTTEEKKEEKNTEAATESVDAADLNKATITTDAEKITAAEWTVDEFSVFAIVAQSASTSTKAMSAPRRAPTSPATNTIRVYFDTSNNSWFTNDSCVPYIKTNSDSNYTAMTACDGSTQVYYADISNTVTSVQFSRTNSNGTYGSTSSQTIDSSKTYFKANSNWNTGEQNSGSWYAATVKTYTLDTTASGSYKNAESFYMVMQTATSGTTNQLIWTMTKTATGKFTVTVPVATLGDTENDKYVWFTPSNTDLWTNATADTYDNYTVNQPNGYTAFTMSDTKSGSRTTGTWGSSVGISLSASTESIKKSDSRTEVTLTLTNNTGTTITPSTDVSWSVTAANSSDTTNLIPTTSDSTVTDGATAAYKVTLGQTADTYTFKVTVTVGGNGYTASTAIEVTEDKVVYLVVAKSAVSPWNSDSTKAYSYVWKKGSTGTYYEMTDVTDQYTYSWTDSNETYKIWRKQEIDSENTNVAFTTAESWTNSSGDQTLNSTGVTVYTVTGSNNANTFKNSKTEPKLKTGISLSADKTTLTKGSDQTVTLTLTNNNSSAITASDVSFTVTPNGTVTTADTTKSITASGGTYDGFTIQLGSTAGTYKITATAGSDTSNTVTITVTEDHTVYFAVNTSYWGIDSDDVDRLTDLYVHATKSSDSTETNVTMTKYSGTGILKDTSGNTVTGYTIYQATIPEDYDTFYIARNSSTTHGSYIVRTKTAGNQDTLYYQTFDVKFGSNNYTVSKESQSYTLDTTSGIDVFYIDHDYGFGNDRYYHLNLYTIAQAGITVSPASSLVPLEGTVTLTAVATGADGNPVSNPSITWTSSDNTNAKVAAAEGDSTTATVTAGQTAGTYTITATYGAYTATASVTVYDPTAVKTIYFSKNGVTSDNWGADSAVPYIHYTSDAPTAVDSVSGTTGYAMTDTGIKYTDSDGNSYSIYSAEIPPTASYIQFSAGASSTAYASQSAVIELTSSGRYQPKYWNGSSFQNWGTGFTPTTVSGEGDVILLQSFTYTTASDSGRKGVSAQSVSIRGVAVKSDKEKILADNSDNAKATVSAKVFNLEPDTVTWTVSDNNQSYTLTQGTTKTGHYASYLLNDDGTVTVTGTTTGGRVTLTATSNSETKDADGKQYSGSVTISVVKSLGITSLYYDASLTKTEYVAADKNSTDSKETTEADVAIPDNAAGSVVYYALYNSNKAFIVGGSMTQSTQSNYTDIWSADVSQNITNAKYVRFGADEISSSSTNSKYPDITDYIEITDEVKELVNPCFVGNSGDADVYDGVFRSGYWAEAYEIRTKGSSSATALDTGTYQGNHTTTVNDKTTTTIYVDSEHYDYLSDWELNGNKEVAYTGDNGVSYRNWNQFKVFNQALSALYVGGNSGSSYALYEGHFQPAITVKSYNEKNEAYSNTWGYPFSTLAGVMHLYTGTNGYTDSTSYNFYNSSGNLSAAMKEFYYLNNSVLDSDGTNNNGANAGYYQYATQGLVGSVGEKGTVGAASLPFFNSSFLAGSNSIHTKLANTYSNVKFPLTSESVAVSSNDSGSPTKSSEYYVFDSADTTLHIAQDGSQLYMKDTGNQEWSKNVNSSGVHNSGDSVSNEYGYFPFNEESNDLKNNGSKYDFGFGSVLTINFKLSSNGTVKAEDGTTLPQVFTFSGDDDVWIYIDDTLVLDIGGDHGRVNGAINFAKSSANATYNYVKFKNSSKQDYWYQVPAGNTYVSDVKKGAGNTSGKINGQKSDISSLLNDNDKLHLYDGKTHTLKMYYMERGQWESNMRIAMNIDITRDYTVAKNWADETTKADISDSMDVPDSVYVAIKRNYTGSDNKETNLEFVDLTSTEDNPITALSSDGKTNLKVEDFKFGTGNDKIYLLKLTKATGWRASISGLDIYESTGTYKYKYTAYEVKTDTNGDPLRDSSGNPQLYSDGEQMAINGVTFTASGGQAESSTQVSTLTNTKNATIAVKASKEWLNADGTKADAGFPDSIYVMLERSTDGTTYTPVSVTYTGAGTYKQAATQDSSTKTAVGTTTDATGNVIPISKDNSWTIEVTALDKASGQTDYTYRFVEVADSSGTAITDAKVTYTVSGSTVKFDVDNGTLSDGIQTIKNKFPKTYVLPLTGGTSGWNIWVYIIAGVAFLITILMQRKHAA